MSSGLSVGRALLRIFAGPMIWFAHLNGLYGLHTLMCVRGSEDSFGAWAAGITAFALSATAAAGLTLWRNHSANRPAAIGAALCALSGLGISWTASAVALATTSCH